MSDSTKIEWATHTFNPWIGCTKVSPGCLNCYAENSAPTRVARANGEELWGRGNARQRTSAAYWKQPLKWNRGPFSCDKCGQKFKQLTGRQKLCEPIPGGPCQHCNFGRYARPRIFPSLCDWLDDEVPIEWLADFLKVIHDTPHLDWLLLTKRPENWRLRLEAVFDWLLHNTKASEAGYLARMITDWIDGHKPPVWIGTSVEDQTRADERIPALLKIPAKVHFLSVEPLLSELDLTDALWKPGCEPHCGDKCSKDADCPLNPLGQIHWVIIGGESGPGARPCNVEWIRDLVRQCNAAGVATFVKQLGSNPVGGNGWPAGSKLRPARHDPKNPSRNFEVALRHPKGGEPSEWPEDLRVREFPIV